MSSGGGGGAGRGKGGGSAIESVSTGNGNSASLNVRLHKKLEQLKETSMERYVTREQRIVATLNFCQTALERLGGWAVFAIFPADELNGDDRYVKFVQQRFECVATQLDRFAAVIAERELKQDSDSSNTSSATADAERSKQNSRLSLEPHSSSRHHSSSSTTRADSPRSVDTGAPSSYSPSMTPPALLPPDHVRGGRDDAEWEGESLCDRIAAMSKRYVEDGEHIRRQVLAKLDKFRTDLHTVYKWGLSSLTDLTKVLDEAMADELFYMVRGRMSRVLSDVAVFEEAAQEIEKTMSNGRPNSGGGGGSGPGRSTTPSPAPTLNQSRGSVGDSSDNHVRQSSGAFRPSKSADICNETAENGALKDSGVQDLNFSLNASRSISLSSSSFRPEGSSEMNAYLRRLESMEARAAAQQGTAPRPHSVVPPLAAPGVLASLRDDDDEESIDSTSTPEPPNSPRPLGLINHPRILKDKLHNSGTGNGASGSGGRQSSSSNFTSRSVDTLSW